MMLTPLDVAPFQPTQKQPGDIVVQGHVAYRVTDDGSWTPLDRPSRLDRLETALSRHWITSWGWVLLLGLGIAAPIVGFAILRGGS